MEYETIRKVVFARYGEVELLADIYRPLGLGPHPGVLLIHGGGWLIGNRHQLTKIACRLAPLGYTVMAIDYRLAPKNKFPSQIEDCREALRWMQENAAEYKIDPQRLGVWGYSAGGQLAALLGTTSPIVSAVVAGGAPCDFSPVKPDNGFLVYWLGGTRREMPEAYKNASPANFVSKDDPPFFFYHGQYDLVVPIDQPSKMAKHLREANVPAEVYKLEKVGHIGAMQNDKAVERGIEFMRKHLIPIGD
ncbi:MAG: alpha/beta hydrolase [Pirellulales bacterium]|nr:alpha/beta hydrolase [Pirellulales bacterium]